MNLDKDLIYSIFDSVDHPTNCYALASLCQNFNQIYRDNKYRILRQIFINHILSNDTNFVNYMRKFKNIFAQKGFAYLDNHTFHLGRIKKLCITIIMKRNEVLLSGANVIIHPNVWIFPIYDANIYQCKNPLYYENGQINLTRISTGATLYRENMAELHQNGFLIQEYYSSTKDVNILLTLDQFNEIF